MSLLPPQKQGFHSTICSSQDSQFPRGLWFYFNNTFPFLHSYILLPSLPSNSIYTPGTLGRPTFLSGLPAPRFLSNLIRYKRTIIMHIILVLFTALELTGTAPGTYNPVRKYISLIRTRNYPKYSLNICNTLSMSVLWMPSVRGNASWWSWLLVIA